MKIAPLASSGTISWTPLFRPFITVANLMILISAARAFWTRGSTNEWLPNMVSIEWLYAAVYVYKARTNENCGHERLLPREQFHDFAAPNHLIGVPNADVRPGRCITPKVGEFTCEEHLHKNACMVIEKPANLRWLKGAPASE